MLNIAFGVFAVLVASAVAFALVSFLGSWGWPAMYVLALWIGHLLHQHYQHHG